MSEFESLNAEQREFERSLKQLQPVDPQLNTAELMFRAGQDAARRESRRQLRCWQLSTLATSVCALAAVLTLWPGSAPTPADESRIATNHDADQSASPEEVNTDMKPAIETPRPAPQAVVNVDEQAISPPPPVENIIPLFDWWNRSATVSVSTDGSYLDLRNRVLREGVDALPKREFSGGSGSDEPLTSSPLRIRDALDQDLWNQI